MKVWRSHTYTRRHRRAYSLSIHLDGCCGWLDVILGRHSWALEVEW